MQAQRDIQPLRVKIAHVIRMPNAPKLPNETDFALERIQTAIGSVIKNIFERAHESTDLKFEEGALEGASEKICEGIKKNLTIFLYERYEKYTNLAWSDILKGAISVEYDKGFKIKTTFKINGEETSFVFGRNGDIVEASAPSPEEEQEKLKKEVLKKEIAIKVTKEITDYLTNKNVNLLNAQGEGSVIVSQKDKLLNILFSRNGYLPSEVLIVTPRKNSENVIGNYVSVNGTIVTRMLKNEAHGILLTLNKEGKMVEIKEVKVPKEELTRNSTEIRTKSYIA